MSKQLKCPHCQNSDRRMIEPLATHLFLCVVCSHVFEVTDETANIGEGEASSESAEKEVPGSKRT